MDTLKRWPDSHIDVSKKPDCYLFLKHGGEWVTYAKDDRATMDKMYREMISENKKNEYFRNNIITTEKHYRGVPLQKEKDGIEMNLTMYLMTRNENYGHHVKKDLL